MQSRIKYLAIVLAIILIIIEGYLIMSYLLDNDGKNKEIKNYCHDKCEYNKESLTWEFSGESFTKGFTTEDECFRYCSKIKQGFTASLLNSIVNLIKR